MQLGNDICARAVVGFSGSLTFMLHISKFLVSVGLKSFQSERIWVLRCVRPDIQRQTLIDIQIYASQASTCRAHKPMPNHQRV